MNQMTFIDKLGKAFTVDYLDFCNQLLNNKFHLFGMDVPSLMEMNLQYLLRGGPRDITPESIKSTFERCTKCDGLKADGLLAQARKRDTMLDDICNLIDERDILLAEKALLEAERDELKITISGLDGEANKLAWRVAELERQNALLVEALEASKDLIVAVKFPNQEYVSDVQYVAIKKIREALAAVEKKK